MYKVRVILDTKEDVIRTILFDEVESLETLHFTIANAFNFDGKEMASFYKTDEEWNQGEEIPLFNMSETGDGISMENCFLYEILPNLNDKLIYVYDFLQMWTFYVEIIDISKETISDSKVILSVGDVPKEAPDKEFKAEKSETSYENEFGDEFNEFDNLDDIDFDKY